jgi:hypothetical protein
MFSMRRLESETVANEAKVKHSTILALYAEHGKLHKEVICQRGQSLDDAAKAKICALHPDLDACVRDNYLKIGRRLVRFQQQLPIRLPLVDHGTFAKWYRMRQDV